MTDVFPDALYGSNTFTQYMDKVEAGDSTGDAAEETPAAITAGETDTTQAPATGEPAQPPGSTTPVAGSTEDEPAGQPADTGGAAPAGTYSRDESWERGFVDQLGTASTAIANKVREESRQDVLEDMRQEYAGHFQLLDTPARILVGKEVPSLDPDRETDRIADITDARDYQEATKELLARELQGRVVNRVQENSEYLSVVGQSIDVLQSNPDLLRDRQFADRVAGLIKPYEYRQDGKLVGWTVDVKPLITQVRAQLAAERAASPSRPGAAPKSRSAAPADPPQAGIRASANQSSGDESFDQLWSTLGFAPGTISL